MYNFKRILAAAGNDPGVVINAARRLQQLEACAELDTFHLDNAKAGHVLDELLQHASETRADVLAVGARQHVIASRAAMLAPCSVLMMPDRTTLSFDNVLVPVDFSEPAADAARSAVQLAEKAKGDWCALTIECPEEPWLTWTSDEEETAGKLEAFVESSTGRNAAGKCLVEPLSHAIRSLASADGVEGVDIASTIVEVAARERASLLVIGTRGRTRSASVLLGSVAEHVMRMATCPVLAVKRPGTQLGMIEAVWERLRHSEPSVAAN